MLKKIISFIFAVLSLSGCSMLPCNQYTAAEAAPLPASGKYIVTEPDAFYRDAEIADRLALYPATNKFYASHKQLDDYVAELAMQLYHASSAPIAEARVAVAGFAELTPARNNLHPLGNALSERFLQQMPRYGVTMVDHKLTGRITLTADGDAVFSNKAGQVAASQQIDYILSGTVQHSQRGAQVNVRLMNLKSKAVLATASQLIPQFVLDNVVYHW